MALSVSSCALSQLPYKTLCSLHFMPIPLEGILMLIAHITVSASATIGLVFTPTSSNSARLETGCSLSNITQTRSSDLVYGFPIDAPMSMLFVDIYSAGADLNFYGTKHYLIAACGMTSFGICEPTSEQTAAAFAAALMKIWLRFGFSHNSCG